MKANITHKKYLNIAIFNDTFDKERHIGCNLVMRNMNYLFKKNGLRIVLKYKVWDDWRKKEEEVRNKIKKYKVDAIIVNGEGTLHSSEDRPYVHGLAELGDFAKTKLSIPVFIINATFHNNSVSFYQKLRSYDGIFVRDKQSIRELEANGISAEYAPDFTFLTTLSMEDNKGRARSAMLTSSNVGVTDSVCKEITSNLYNISKENGWSFKKMIKTTTDDSIFLKMIRKFPPKIVENINTLISRLKKESPEDFIKWISKKDLILTGRLHTVTLCIITETSFYSLESNTPKISSILIDIFGNKNRIIDDLNDINNPILINKFYYNNEEIEKIKQYKEMAIERSQLMIEKIKEKILRNINFT